MYMALSQLSTFNTGLLEACLQYSSFVSDTRNLRARVARLLEIKASTVWLCSCVVVRDEVGPKGSYPEVLRPLDLKPNCIEVQQPVELQCRLQF